MKHLRSVLTPVLLALGFAAAGCETMKGAGRDLEDAGEAIEDAAEDVDDDLE